MNYTEIIQKLREKDNKVTECFFFWDGPTLQRMDALRRKDPIAAAQLNRPVCDTCRPTLLAVLHKLYGDMHFNYKEKVVAFYYYLMDGDKLSSINNPETLMGWITTTAYYFFLSEKKSEDRLSENDDIESLNNVKEDIEEDDSRAKSREIVAEVIAAMPNKVYAKILEEVVLEVGQYSGRQKTELFRRKSKEMGIPVDNLYTKISLAKKQFKQTALKLNIM